MPELKNVFHAGKMNKDLDERLIPNGQYRDALNIDVSFSESSDAGSAQNAYGNVQVSDHNITGAKCIGSIVNEENDTIIWFICGTSVDAIAEYDPSTGSITPILVDTNKGTDNAFLSFNSDYLITGINILDDFLFFTDNTTEPKKIHMGRMKNGSTNFSTTTKYQNSDGTYTKSVYTDLITVIKKYPLQAPKISLSNVIREGNVNGISHNQTNTSFTKSNTFSTGTVDSQDFNTNITHANTSGSSTIYKATDVSYLETTVVNNASDSNANTLVVNPSNFSTGNDYKKWRAVEPGMRVAISSNGSGSWTEPNIYYIIETVDWLNHTVSFVDRSLPPVANNTKIRIQHWSEPFNNSNFWAYIDNSGNLVKKPIGTTSENSLDLDNKLIVDGGALNDGSGKDVALFQSAATGPAVGSTAFGQGWSYNSGTKTYHFAGGSGATGTKHYPLITGTTDLLKGHTYNLKATITVTTEDVSTPSAPAFIGFFGKANTTIATAVNGLNSLETYRYYNGTYEIDIIWKQLQDGADGQMCLVASDEMVGSIKINSIECLTKPRPVKIQPLQFYGTDYEVGDIISLQAEDSGAVSVDDDSFVDIKVRLIDKITVKNTKSIPTSHANAVGSGVTGNDKISNGDFSSLTTWHTGLSGTTDVGTSAAGFYVTSGGLSSNGTSDGYIRNVLSENLVADEVYKLTYDVAAATSGSSDAGYLKLVLSTNNVYVGDDTDFGHTNHIVLDTSTTGSKTVYFKQKSLARGALSLSELLFYNDHDWDARIDNVVLKKVTGTSTTSCGTIGTDDGKQLFDCEIVSIDDTIISNLDKTKFKSKRAQPEAIYEKEFARFSFRWKYVDNEYSAISPFTEVAFLPLSEKGYSYDSKDGYNKSMINDVRRITLSGFSKPPKDAKSIDILYKKSNSTSVYIVKTIEHSDFENIKTNDSVVITLEEIKSLLPENQMLRPYDNVPRKALAQEITGNRVVYGNYTQQYDYFSTPSKFKTKINSTEITEKPLKSLKSIRDYQVGVSFLDDFGRQSPVFTHESGVVKVDQSKSASSNSLEVSLNSPPPTWATHYKYFVKDSSNEYYNLAMDRFYPDLEDENVWISFPSSEINKVNENDYVAIKKEHGTENAATVTPGETAKYKVLDKQAEPPNHIKFTMAEVGASSEKTTFSVGDIVSSSDSNTVKNEKYRQQTTKYPTKGSNTFLLSVYDLRDDPDFLDELSSFITNTGVWYDMPNRFVQISDGDGTLSEKYEVDQIYKKSQYFSINPDGTQVTPDTSDSIKGIIPGFKALCFKTNGGQNNTSIDLLNNAQTTHSNSQTVSNLGLIEIGMRVVNTKDGNNFSGKDVFVVSITNQTVKLSQSIEVTDEQEIFFRDNKESFLFRLKRPFGFDVEFVGSSPQSTRIDLINIDNSSFDAVNTVLPNPQDLDLKATFFKQTTDDFGEEFKGKFFVKIKRDSYLNDFITRTIASTNTWVSRDSAKVFSAKTWLLDQANSDAIVAGTNAADSSPLIRSILSIPPNSDYKLIDGSYDHFTTARSKFGKSISVDPDIAGQETYADVFASGQSRTLNGNGFNLNPESVDADDFTATKNGVDYTNGYSPVDWAATGLFNGSKIRLKFGGSTRGIMKSNQYSQNSINGLNMQFLNYDTPSLSGGSKTPRLVIDQTVGFRGTSSYNFARPEPYVGDGWVVGNTFCSFKITGINGAGKGKGNLGQLYNLYKYLITPGQNFRFPSDPTNTVYKIVRAETFFGYNTDARDSNGSIDRLHTSWSYGAKEEKAKFSEIFLGINIQLDKAIYWSPMEEADKRGSAAIDHLELSASIYTRAKIFSGSEPRTNREKYVGSNGRSFSACEVDFGEVDISVKSPAVFEVLPKDKVDLNIFYETPSTKMILKDGMSVKTDYRTVNGENPLDTNAVINLLPNSPLNRFVVSPNYVNHNIPKGETVTVYKKDINGDEIYSEDIVLKDTLSGVSGGSVSASGSGLPTLNSSVVNIVDSNWSTLNYFNCFAFGNGVESNRIFDDYNAVTIDKGPRVSTILDQDYAEEVKSNGLIYSGIYNSSSSFNSTNQFIQGEKITKDLNPDYGPIQKLHTRDTNIVVLCEDKVLKVLANKDALFNADGNPQLTATNRVLGQAVPFAGEYGISKNPESFASHGYRCYFSDRKRGAMLRLSMDGLTNISEKGMSKYFRENLDNSLNVVGSYDVLKSNYNVTLNNKTLSFTEKVNGWVSFKSFLPENGISCNNSYYTFKDGEMWLHNENLTRNNFYSNQYNSTIKLVFNGEPDTVKDFKTVSYEGDSGWTANTITTDKETGSISTFVEKEGKYFNFIKGAKINNDVDLLKTQGLNVQGIGKPSTINLNSNVRSFTHTVTAVDIASNVEPKKWIINNSTDSTATSKVIKFNEKAASNVTGKTVDFYIHPQTSRGITWKLAAEDFTFSLTEPTAINNFAGTVAATLQGNGSIRVRITYVSNPFPSSNTATTLTITAGSAYQEQI